MREKDSIAMIYFEDEERFADLLNAFLFEGRQVIHCQDIREKEIWTQSTICQVLMKMML